MADGPADDQRFDLDHTDELPILLETVVLPADAAPGELLEDTGEHTARFSALPLDQGPDLVALRTDLALRAARIDALETDIANLSSRWNDVERHLTTKDLTIQTLTTSVTGLRESLQRVETAEQRLTATLAERDTALEGLHTEITGRDTALDRLRAELAERDATVDRLRAELDEQRRSLAATDAEVEQQRRTATARAAELDGSHATIAALRSEIEALRTDLAARTATASQAQELSRLLEETAGLSTYIANRRVWWDALEAEAKSTKEQVAALQRELATATARRRDAEALAARESERASRSRAELIAQSLKLESAQRELAATRTTEAEPNRRIDRLAADLEAARAATEQAVADLAAAAAAHAAERNRLHGENERQAVSLAALETEIKALHEAEHEAATRAATEPTFDVVAQLEAEVEHKRQQVTAQLVELRDREQRLTTATTDIERLQGELAAARAEIESMRATTTRLERTLIDKDRTLEARDARIAMLQEELSQRLGALQRLNAMDLSLQGLDSKMSERLRRTEPSPERHAQPTLVCLTGDAPRQFALTKPATTIGRSAHCDIQIMTHFISREHARVTVGHAGAQIEDLGSTNGVFVNSTRVERQELHHGDVVTVGETKFRYLESMAH